MKVLRFCLFFTILGCSFLPFRNEPLPRVEGQIIQPQVLQEGGKVLIVPFSAGIYAAATEKLDKAALIIGRGIEDGLKAEGGRFQMIYDQKAAQNPELLITGRIERLETRDGWMRYVGGSRKRFSEVRGKVLDENNALVAIFHYEMEKRYQDISEVDFLLKMGEDVGKFLKGEN